MKSIKIILFVLSTSACACNSSNNRNITKDSTQAVVEGPDKIVDERYLIVPGISIGEISLGEDVEKVGEKLGKPDAGDAAMGKAWAIWYNEGSTGKHRNEVAIYSSYRDTSMKVKDVKQIRITSSRFKTQDGFGTDRTLSDTEMKFPGIEKKSTYLNESKDTVLIYDSKTDGIGFEFLNGKSISLSIHAKNTSLNDTYLAVHPEWKVLR